MPLFSFLFCLLCFAPGVNGVELRVDPSESNFVLTPGGYFDHVPVLGDAKFSTSGNTIVLSDHNGKLYVLSLLTMKMVQVNLPAAHTPLDMNPSQDEFAAVTSVGEISFFDATTGSLNHKCAVAGKGVTSIKFAPSGKSLLANSDAQGLDLIDTQCKIIRQLLPDGTGINVFRITPDEKYLITNHFGKAEDDSFKEAGDEFYRAASTRRGVQLYELSPRDASPASAPKQIWSTIGHGGWIEIAPLGTYFVYGAPTYLGTIQFAKFDEAADIDFIQSIIGPASAKFSPDGKVLGTILRQSNMIPLCLGRFCLNYAVQIWETDHQQLTLKDTIATTIEQIDTIDFHPKKRIFLRTSHYRSDIMLRNIEDHTELLIDVGSPEDVVALSGGTWDATSAGAKRLYAVNGTETETVGLTGKFKSAGLIQSFLSRAKDWEGRSE